MEKKERKRIFADFYKKLFNKSWMQKVDVDTDWYHPSKDDYHSLSDPSAISSQGNLGPS